MNLNQVTLPAVDMDASVGFYLTLGFVLIVDQRPDYVRFECPKGDSTLSLESSDYPAGHPSATIYFEVARLDALYRSWRNKGMSEGRPVNQPWLWREWHLTDPGGNRICIYHAGENRKNPPWRVGSY